MHVAWYACSYAMPFASHMSVSIITQIETARSMEAFIIIIQKRQITQVQFAPQFKIKLLYPVAIGALLQKNGQPSYFRFVCIDYKIKSVVA